MRTYLHPALPGESREDRRARLRREASRKTDGHRAANRAWKKRNPESNRRWLNFRHERNKNETLTAYGKDGTLCCCGPDCNVRDVDMLTLDHIHNNGAEHRRQKGHRAKSGVLYAQLRREGFPKGEYQTLCANHQLKKAIEIKRSIRKEPPMFVTTKIVLDLNQPLPGGRFAVLDHDGYEYEGLVSLCKGDPEIKAQESQQAGFNTQLRQIFSDQFGKQSGVLNFLNNKLTDQVKNPEGFTPEQKAALETTNTEGASKAFAHAQEATQTAVAGRGGSTLPNGVTAQLTAENATAGATQLATGENQIAVADAEQKQNNTWRALNGLNEVAGMENPSGYGSLANGGAAEVGSLGSEYNSTQQSPLFSALGGIAGAGISAVAKHYGG